MPQNVNSDWTFNPEETELFITRWEAGEGAERANYQLFLIGLCRLLGLPEPDPARDDTRDNAYVFERRVTIRKPDGSQTSGFIDLYRRGSFVLEAKQSGLDLESERWDKAMLRAQNQAENYVRALHVDEGRPPFVVVTDVGRSIELYSEFTRSGATYTAFPDSRSYRIGLTDLRKPELQKRLRKVWLDPLSLDPSRVSARVTREIADNLAKLAKSLEGKGHSPQLVAEFMMRALFTMFGEDVGLLPQDGFLKLLRRLEKTPENFQPMLEVLWKGMNEGGFSAVFEQKLLRFNGGLFAQPKALPLNRDQIGMLIRAAEADWRQVEPAIFGTLLERALDPKERHKLGAHYTPRAYVERLVLPTVMEPLRQEWKEVQTAALAYEKQGRHKQAVKEVLDFLKHLCSVRVLDPACGSGNFLYVTLEHMKRLEGEVLALIRDLGETGLLEMEGITVSPHQFLGLEINPRAARIAEMVLWIGYLQWHFRTHGKVNPPEPVLKDFKNIKIADAVLEYDSTEVMLDKDGKPVTRWDGETYKPSPVTGEMIPDETARVQQYRYLNPRKAVWPEAEYIVGNPPFIGAKLMRTALGDGYVDALQEAWPEIPQATDFVLRWWHKAATLVAAKRCRSFGLITSNSISQAYNRRAIEPFLSDSSNPISLIFAIPDHPWIDDGASVRIAMTVGVAGRLAGVLASVTHEYKSRSNENHDLVKSMELFPGRISSSLKVGVDLARARSLSSNRGLCAVGFKTIGAAFQVDKQQAETIGLGKRPEIKQFIKPYFSGRDLAGQRRGIYVVDFFGLSVEELKNKFPEAYQYLLDHAKPFRDQQRNKVFKEKWWIIGHPRPVFREFSRGLGRYVATIETSKHRFFSFCLTSDAPDSTLVTFGLSNGEHLGILSSRLHTAWALAAGGRLGVGNDPRYNKTVCFETFPFPDPTDSQKSRIRDLAERLDAHRKRQQEQHPGLTLTGMYNVLETLRSGETLTKKERTIHEQGLVSVLREIHDELDREVFAAYGWEDLADKLVGLPGATTPLPNKSEEQAEAEEELLKRLVALNAQRAAEEARGIVRWLRPEYQNPGGVEAVDQGEQGELDTQEAAAPVRKTKQPWPKTIREQVAAVRSVLQQGPQSSEQVAAHFRRAPRTAVESVLEALNDLGMLEEEGEVFSLVA